MHLIINHFLTRRNIFIIFAIIFISVIFGYIGEATSISVWIKDFFGELVGYNRFVAGGVFVLMACVSAMLSFFTSTPVIPVAVAIWGKTTTLFLLFGGWLLGACVAYYVGRVAAHLISRFRFFRKVELYRKQLGDSSEFILLLLFRLAVPAEIGSYTLGLLRFNFLTFMIITAISEFPFAILAIFSSQALVGPNPIMFAVLISFGLIAMSIFIYFFHSRLKKLRGDFFIEE